LEITKENENLIENSVKMRPDNFILRNRKLAAATYKNYI